MADGEIQNLHGLWIKIKAQNVASQVLQANTLSKSEQNKEIIFLITGALKMLTFYLH